MCLPPCSSAPRSAPMRIPRTPASSSGRPTAASRCTPPRTRRSSGWSPGRTSSVDPHRDGEVALVAVVAHASCLARGGRTYYTAPIQRLRSTTGQRRRKPARVGGVARDSASARADAGLDAGGRADRGVVHCANVRPACPDPAVAAGGSLGNDVPLGRLFAAAAAAGAESAVVGDLQPAVEAGFLTVDGDRIWFGHRLVAAAIYQSSTIADRLAMQPRCRMRSAPTTIDGCGTLKRLLQFILRAARRQPARDSRSGVSQPLVRAPSNCMIRRNSPARMSSTYATPLGPPAISP